MRQRPEMSAFWIFGTLVILLGIGAVVWADRQVSGTVSLRCVDVREGEDETAEDEEDDVPTRDEDQMA